MICRNRVHCHAYQFLRSRIGSAIMCPARWNSICWLNTSKSGFAEIGNRFFYLVDDWESKVRYKLIILFRYFLLIIRQGGVKNTPENFHTKHFSLHSRFHAGACQWRLDWWKCPVNKHPLKLFRLSIMACRACLYKAYNASKALEALPSGFAVMRLIFFLLPFQFIFRIWFKSHLNDE